MWSLFYNIEPNMKYNITYAYRLLFTLTTW